MRSMLMFVSLAVVLTGFTECPSRPRPPIPGHGGHAGHGGDGDGKGEACGPATCRAGEVCCNESCGICTKPGGFCTQQVCGEPEPTGPFCGGIAGFPCPGAGTCVDDPRDDCDPTMGGADCGGVCDCSLVQLLCIQGTVFDNDPNVCACVPSGSGIQCGGFAGFPCPGLGMCVDDASDDCDPTMGGADCGGLCECNPAAISCPRGTVLNADPSVCACEAPAGGQPCGSTTCGEGMVCCNESCGICTPPDGACIQIACLPSE